MAIAIAYDDAKKNQIRRENPGPRAADVKTPFFGSSKNPDAPHAALNHYAEGRKSYSGTHFHVRDQFQLVVAGKGKIGRHNLAPYCVHFTRAYTPYGPLVTDGSGLTFMVMRAHYDPGSQHLPKEQEQLKRVPDRQPWQISRAVTFPTLQTGTTTPGMVLQAVPDVKDENGLAVYSVSMKPNAQALAPDPSRGDGQYLVVVKGSLLHQHKEHKGLALIFVEPEEGPLQLHAGAEGLEAIVLNFPQVKPHAARTTAPSTATGHKKWQCTLCSFVYDEAQGMPEEGIAAGTLWQDVPDTWSCPDCSAGKSDFEMVEV